MSGQENVQKDARILIIDDDKKLVAHYREILDKAGYKTDAAFDGKDGLQKLKTQGADLVILDIEMPKMDGIKVLEAIRDDEALRKTKVMVASSYSYKNALSWLPSGRVIKNKKMTHLGEKAEKEGMAKGGYAGRMEVEPKPKKEMKEHYWYGGHEARLETPQEFEEKFREWLLREVKNMLAAKPEPFEREKLETEPDRILIVDDDKAIVEKIAGWLKPLENCQFLFAYNGAEALEKIAKEDIDLVILDLKMPDTEGDEVLKVMHSIPVVDHTPVLVFTSLTDTTTTDSLFDIAPTTECIDEKNIRSRIRKYQYEYEKRFRTFDKPAESKLSKFLHLDKPRDLIAKVKFELEERRRLGKGYKKGSITLLRNKKGRWLEGYLEGYESYYGGEHRKCAYCEEDDKYPALEYRKMSVWSPPRICGDCAKELKAKYSDNYPKL
ncbi:MAG: response regulator [Candidatus Omnitrophica bacterium]|nr:response regulator [Candidatus Omnitrophota bacterium]